MYSSENLERTTARPIEYGHDRHRSHHRHHKHHRHHSGIPQRFRHRFQNPSELQSQSFDSGLSMPFEAENPTTNFYPISPLDSFSDSNVINMAEIPPQINNPHIAATKHYSRFPCTHGSRKRSRYQNRWRQPFSIAPIAGNSDQIVSDASTFSIPSHSPKVLLVPTTVSPIEESPEWPEAESHEFEEDQLDTLPE